MRQPIGLIILMGCSDYQVTAEETGTLQVSPSSVVLEGACSYEERTVTLQSIGEYAVTVESLDIDGDGWVVLSAPTLPVSIEPGNAVEVVVLGNEGDARLVVTSDDPEGSVTTVHLLGTANDPPTIVWTSHADNDVVEPGEALVVDIEDTHDAAEDLVVAWSSNLDGALSIAYGDAEGQATTTWDDATGGEHTLVATVTDTCGASASAEIEVCRQAGYLSDSLDLSTWAMGGHATYDSDNGWVELTNVSDTFQAGSAFQTTSTTGDQVKLAFSFYVSGGTGADGFAITALDTERATSYMAQSGGCLGYGGGGVCGDYDPLYGWNVEVDTYFSPDLDPTEEDHLSFHFDGDVAGYEAFAELPDMEDDSWHEMVIEVVAPRVTISIDGVTYIDEDIEGYFSFPAEVGFTAATGGETNYHLIDSLSVIEDVCDEAE